MDNLGKILIISPHRDDETLGCGGLISKLDPENLHIRYYNSRHTDVADSVYDREALELQNFLGCETSYCLLQDVNRLPEHPIAEFINDIEETVRWVGAQTVLVPFPSYNQDHRYLFDAAITATRVHDRNIFPKNILAYEQPETLHTNRFEPHFVPHVFTEINLEDKLRLYQFYQSQIRGHRSFTHVETLARLRGMQCGKMFAESFMVVRLEI